MNRDWKTNSSIYLSNNSKIYMYCLYPILVLLILLISFIYIDEIEVIVKSDARIVGEEVLIQTTSDELIKENYLEENKQVKKGDVLVKYEATNYLSEQDDLSKRIAEIDDELLVLNVFKKSLEENTNFFVKSDKYGFYNKFNEYQSSISTYDKKIDLVNKINATQKSNQGIILDEINQLIFEKNNYISELNNFRTALSNNNDLNTTYENIASKFNMIQENLSIGTKEENKIKKISYLAEIDSEIKQLESEIDNMKLTKAQNEIESIEQDNPDILAEEKKKLKEANIIMVKESQGELNRQKNELVEEQKKIKRLISELEIKAPSDGVVHLNEEVDKTSVQLAKGIKLASLFIHSEGKVEIETLIPANEINKVKVGRKMKIELDKKGVSKAIYDGEISEIPQTSIVTEDGVYYLVKGIITSNNKNIRLGEVGRISIIVGKKKYINYIKDILFDS